jgi:hypothetical protein
VCVCDTATTKKKKKEKRERERERKMHKKFANIKNPLNERIILISFYFAILLYAILFIISKIIKELNKTHKKNAHN